MRLVVICLTMASLSAEPVKPGHSHRSPAFDEGPRQKPVKMDGIGQVSFPITSKNPEVQQWFNQGTALLHSFWFHEAERSFRWTLKLDPECAMCWWGLSRAVGDPERGRSILREAVKRKDKVTRRERLFIEASEVAPGYDFFRSDGDEKFKYAWEKILLEYPNDLEAKLLYAGTNLGGTSRLMTDRILKEIIVTEPDHPGAHHYRIHNWNYREGAQALDASREFARIVPSIGHAQHMPGHIYSTVGMWHEAAISMDTATRVEARYMSERMIMPFHDWNYGHNRNYLNYILEQLGMARAAIAGGKELIATPRDPKYSDDNWRSTHRQGMWSLARTLVKFERWNDLLDEKLIPWSDKPREKVWKHYCRALAQRALGNQEKAEGAVRALDAAKPKDDKGLERTHGIMAGELKALLLLKRGETLEGLTMLGEAAKKQYDEQMDDNDPPAYPRVVYLVLGRAYLDAKSPSLAVEAFEKALDLVRNDGFALSGLVDAYTALGDSTKAGSAKARLMHVWSDADTPPKFAVTPKDESPAAQRNYTRTSLEKLGPPHWQPSPAPMLEAEDATGKRVTLADLKGKNVVLVFFLGEECPHCMEQLNGLSKRRDEFARLNTQIVAVSPAKAKAALEGVKLLTDAGKENARRFQSYDDFENIELHSTVLIDREGRVRWSRVGGDAFTDYDFLVKEIERVNGSYAAPSN